MPERVASKGLADWKMLVRKLPQELFEGRRTLPHELFGRSDVRSYLDALEEAISRRLAGLSPGDEIELFDFTRRLGHSMGLASWAGMEILDSPRFDELIDALDALDGAEAFVVPTRMQEVARSHKAAEYEAMAAAEEIIAESIATRSPVGDDLLGTIIERWADTAGQPRLSGIARDVIQVHLASMSNMFAALGWSLVHLVRHPAVLARVRTTSGADRDLASRCVLESTRIGQRSIMLRAVLAPVTVHDGSVPTTCPRGRRSPRSCRSRTWPEPPGSTGTTPTGGRDALWYRPRGSQQRRSPPSATACTPARPARSR